MGRTSDRDFLTPLRNEIKMTTLDRLRALNPARDIQAATQTEFSNYGELVTGFDFSVALDWLDNNSPIPDEGNCYVQGEPELEKLPLKEALENDFWGGVTCQIGYCNGRNTMLNGLEYHKCSELLVAGTDLVLFLAQRQELSDHRISSDKVKSFYLAKGEAVELYATTLHYVPCRVSEPYFRTLIILPQGTNLPLADSGGGGVLRSCNKWFIAHEDSAAQRARGAFMGMNGENFSLEL
jgi:hypothetical protein